MAAALAETDLVWIPGAPIWLVRLVAAVEALAVFGLILPGLLRLPVVTVTLSAAGSLGAMAVKAVVLALTLFILWVRLRPASPEVSMS